MNYFFFVTSLAVIINPIRTSYCLQFTELKEQGIFPIEFSGETTDTPMKSRRFPTLSGLSLNLHPTFFTMKGSFYFCVSSSTSKILNDRRGLTWVTKNHGYSSFALFNWTFYESKDGNDVIQNSLILDHGSSNETKILASLLPKVDANEEYNIRYCYVPDPISLITDERDETEKFRLDKPIFGMHYFEPIVNAVVYYGTIPRTELLGDWSSPVFATAGPMHLVVTNIPEAVYTMAFKGNPICVRSLLPRCVGLGLATRCFTYIYLNSGNTSSHFDVAFHRPTETLMLPKQGEEIFYFLMNNHDYLQFNTDALAKNKNDTLVENTEIVSFCIHSIKDLTVLKDSDVIVQNSKFFKTPLTNLSRRHSRTSSQAIYRGGNSINTYAMGLSYDVGLGDPLLWWTLKQKNVFQFDHEILNIGQFVTQCRLISLTPEDLPNKEDLSEDVIITKNYVERIEMKFPMNQDYVKMVAVSRAAHVRTVAPPEGIAVSVPTTSRFMLVDVVKGCNDTTLVEVEQHDEKNEYVSSSIYSDQNESHGNICHDLFVPLKSSYRPPTALDLYVYQANQTRPILKSSGVTTSISSRICFGLIALMSTVASFYI